MPYGGGPVQRDMGASLGATEVIPMIETIPLKELISISKGKKPTELIDEERVGFQPYLTAAQLLHGEVKQWARGGIETNFSDVLISWDGTVGNVGWGITGIVGSTIGIISPNLERVDVAFLGRFLSTKKRLLNDTATGATIKHIRRSVLENLEFPSIPMDEQKRIAAILDKANEIKNNATKAQKIRDEIIHSSFLEMFGDPVLNEKGWNTRELSECISSIKAGWSSKNENRLAEDGEWGVLKISAVTSGKFNPKEHKFVENTDFKKEPIIPQIGDLLFSRANTRELVGATCIVDQKVERLFLPDKLWRIETYEGIMNKTYLRYLLGHDEFRKTLTKKATGSSGSMLNISQKKLLELLIPLPPIELQNQFEYFVNKASEIFVSANKGIQIAKALNKSSIESLIN